MGLLDTRQFFKPFKYDFCYQAYQTQNKIHWIPQEIAIADDLKDWTKKLTKEEKNLLTQIFRFFTQADIDVAGAYTDIYLQLFKQPEVKMMLLSFSSMEAIHIESYALLIDTLGLPEVEYKAFMDYEAMRNKHEYIQNFNPLKEIFENDRDYHRAIARSLAVFSGFTEGVQLFSSFAILLNFSRFNKMKKMCEIITFSMRDESLHVESMIKLFNVFIDENPKIWKADFKKEIYYIAEEMVDLEFKFIDLCFEQGGIEGLEPEDVKNYVKHIADRRLLQMRLKPIFKQKENPLEWLNWLLVAPSHTNFFEGRETNYSKGALTGDWNNTFEKFFNNKD